MKKYFYDTAAGWSNFTNYITGNRASGTMGNLTWELSCDSVLTISGKGAMPDYSGTSPWDVHRNVIKTVNIGNGVTTIGDFAFSECQNLTFVFIPNSVTSIGSFAFWGCIRLTSTNIPNGITNIQMGTFQDCSSLTSITCNATTPPVLDYLALPTNIPVYIPCGSYAKYSSAPDWSSFTNKIAVGCNLTVLSGADALGVAGKFGLNAYNNPAVIYAIPFPNGLFTGWSDGNTANPRTVVLTSDCTFTANFSENSFSSLQTQISNLQADTAALNSLIVVLNNDRQNLQELLDACQSSLEVGLKSMQSSPVLRIYPNPIQSNGTLNIEGEFLQFGDKIEIYDMQGNLISVNFSTGKETTVHIGNLPVGAYLLRLAGKRGVKFVVE